MSAPPPLKAGFSDLTDAQIEEGRGALTAHIGTAETLRPYWFRRLALRSDGVWCLTFREAVGGLPEYQNHPTHNLGPTILTRWQPIPQAVGLIRGGVEAHVERLEKAKAELVAQLERSDLEQREKARRDDAERQRLNQEARAIYDRFGGSAWDGLSAEGQLLFHLALIEDDRDPRAAGKLRALAGICARRAHGAHDGGFFPFPGREWREPPGANRGEAKVQSGDVRDLRSVG